MPRVWPSVKPLSLLTILFTVLIVGIAVYAVWIDLGKTMWGADDALIFFTYARNMVAGHGIVYSTGGPHVEGASSLLYLLVCWLFWSLLPQPNVALLYFNGALIVGSCLLVWYLFRRLEHAFVLPRYSALLLYAAFAVWILANPSFFFWNVVSLMDSGIFSILIMGAFSVLALQLFEDVTLLHVATLSFLIALTVLARPEGMGWGLLEACTFLVIGYAAPRTRRMKTYLLFVPAAVFFLSLAALVAFREVYFGHALPTTYYAKVTQDHLATVRDGARYAKSFLRSYGIGFPLSILVSYGFLIYRFVRGDRSIYLKFLALTVLFTSAALLVPVAEGGDHFIGARLYQPTYPLFCVLAVMVSVPAFRRGYRSGLAALALISLVFLLPLHNPWSRFERDTTKSGPWPFTDNKGVRIETEIATYEMENGVLLDRMFRPMLPSIGVIAAGGFGYTYTGTIHDLVGLNDEQMARADRIKVGIKDHASFNKDVFYLRSPQIVLPLGAQNGAASDFDAHYATNLSRTSLANQMLKDIYSTPRFQAEYQLAVVQQSTGPRLSCYGFFRRDYLQALVQTGQFQVQER